MKRALIELIELIESREIYSEEDVYVCRISQLNSKTSDLQINNLKGAVKSINEYYFNATIKFGELIKNNKFKKQNKIDFNDNGTISEYLTNITKNKRGGSKYIYNDGLCVEEIVFDEDGSLLSRASYRYNTEGDRIEEFINYDDADAKKFSCIYNEKRDIVNKKDITDSCSGSISYSYKNNKIIAKIFLYKTKLHYQLEYEIDHNGNIIKIIKSEPTGSFFFKKFFKTQEITRNYNNSGDIIEENRSEWSDYDEPEYCEQFNSIFKYTYDSIGNWIKVDCAIGSEYTVIEREIEYYE